MENTVPINARTLAAWADTIYRVATFVGDHPAARPLLTVAAEMEGRAVASQRLLIHLTNGVLGSACGQLCGVTDADGITHTGVCTRCAQVAIERLENQ